LYPELQKLSDYVLLIIEVGIREVNVNISIMLIKKDSKKEKNFIKSLIYDIENLKLSSIKNKKDFQDAVYQLAIIFDDIWC